MDPTWSVLPSAIFVPLVGLLSSVELKSMRGVCKNWRQDVDAALSGLTPRNMNNAEVPHLFKAAVQWWQNLQWQSDKTSLVCKGPTPD